MRGEIFHVFSVAVHVARKLCQSQVIGIKRKKPEAPVNPRIHFGQTIFVIFRVRSNRHIIEIYLKLLVEIRSLATLFQKLRPLLDRRHQYNVNIDRGPLQSIQLSNHESAQAVQLNFFFSDLVELTEEGVPGLGGVLGSMAQVFRREVGKYIPTPGLRRTVPFEPAPLRLGHPLITQSIFAGEQ